jgi:hypothetical protein
VFTETGFSADDRENNEGGKKQDEVVADGSG